MAHGLLGEVRAELALEVFVSSSPATRPSGMM